MIKNDAYKNLPYKMEELPSELKEHIGSFMSLPTLLNISCASREMSDVFMPCAKRTLKGEQKRATTYLTHDNGARPFRVSIGENSAVIEAVSHRSPSWMVPRGADIDESFDMEVTYKYFKTVVFERAFIGNYHRNSEAYPAHNPDYNAGNTILLHLSGDQYMYIGSLIYTFRSMSTILSYLSPVCSSDYPYPYAIDEAGRYYLMVDKCILEALPEDIKDPYFFLYFSESCKSSLPMQMVILYDRVVC